MVTTLGTIDRLFKQAFHYHKNEQLEKAEEGYHEVLRLNPDHPSALHLLGLIDFKHNRYDAALCNVEKSLTLAPDDLQWILNYAKILEKSGNVEKAVWAYNQALKIDPGCQIAINRLQNASGKQAEPSFFWKPPSPLKPGNIQFAKIENISLNKLFVAEYEEINSETHMCIRKLCESVPFRYLNGDIEAMEKYRRYIRSRNDFHFHVPDEQAMQEIVKSIRINGYPYRKEYICLYGDENIIRDGKHRAAILLNLWGDRIIPVVRFRTNGSLRSWIPQEGEDKFKWS
jgi:tetratricopeptide (TPR) repeat protein